MIEGWQKRIDEAQNKVHEVIAGKRYERVKFGAESNTPADWECCGDCAVKRGQYHVVSCDWEQCPACGGQAISCACEVQA